MASFFSILNKILREAERINNSSKKQSNYKAKKQLKQESKKEKKEPERPKVNEQVFPQRNKYIVSTTPVEAKAKFYDFYDKNGSLNELTVFAIKNQLRVHEVESYLSINKNRYLEKLSRVYGKQVSFKEISVAQKLEILKGFKPSLYKTATCEIDFFRAVNRRDMIFLLEFDLMLLNKYSWIIDDLGGGPSYQDTWYWLMKAPINELVFMHHWTAKNDLLKVLEVREAVQFVFEPPIEYLIEKLSFPIVRNAFSQKGVKLISREEAKTIAFNQKYQSSDVFTQSDLATLNARFCRTNQSFLHIAKEFESLQEFWRIVYEML